MALRETVARLRASRADSSAPEELVGPWQAAVDQLYGQIAEWLREYIDNDDVSLHERQKSAYEERTGPYAIRQLDIDIGDETIRLDPQGTVVVGARGRIDVSRLGRGDPRLLVLNGTVEQPTWSIVDRSFGTRLTPLTKESFEAVLDQLLQAYDVRSEAHV